MRRPTWIIVLAAFAAGALLVAALAWWLPGPRSSLPTSPTPSSATGTSTAPTPRPIGLPDPVRTPGSINPNVSQANLAETICKPGWASSVRPPSAYTSALKAAQLIEYGYDDRTLSRYQEDHLVPLEVGGAPRDPRNLWPEPNDFALPDATPGGAAAKDGLEDYLNRQVCNGSIPLADAQLLIAGNWIEAWSEAGRP